MTANQLVAYNLRRARELRELTQEQAAERLEPLLGQLWSKATFSSAERSAEPERRAREFTADELLAFSAAFDLPLAWFFLPAETDGFQNVRCGGKKELTAGEVLDAVFPYGGKPEVVERMVQILRRMPKRARTKMDESVLRWAMQRMGVAITAVFHDLRSVAEQNRRTAALLDQAADAALAAAGQELDTASRTPKTEPRKARV
jgi:transcriptional regulator with XRE-family HTH domain